MTSLNDLNNEPTFRGDPAQWWENAEPVSEYEAANRTIGDWYITKDARAAEDPSGRGTSFTVGLPTESSNKARLTNLVRYMVSRGHIAPGDHYNEYPRYTPNEDDWAHNTLHDRVRVLLRTDRAIPDWEASELISCLEPGSSQRALWKKTKSGTWRRVMGGEQGTVSTEKMRGWEPRVVRFVEEADSLI